MTAQGVPAAEHGLNGAGPVPDDEEPLVLEDDELLEPETPLLLEVLLPELLLDVDEVLELLLLELPLLELPLDVDDALDVLLAVPLEAVPPELVLPEPELEVSAPPAPAWEEQDVRRARTGTQ